MTIEFHCPACQQPLRVPNEVAGKNGKCPQCGTIFVVPGASTQLATSVRQANPFADDPAVNPYDVGGIPAREFPQPGPQLAFSSELPVMPQAVDAGPVLSLAFSLWQRHLGLLLGAHVVLFLMLGILGVGQLMVLTSFFEFDGGLGVEYHLASLGFGLFNGIVQTYLWIGLVQICLKLARNQPAEFVDLFQGGNRYFPMLAAWLLIAGPLYLLDFIVTLAVSRGATFGDIDVGIAMAFAAVYFLASILFAVCLWPFPYLVIDRKSTVLACYGNAFRLAQLNIVTTILLFIVSGLVLVAGAIVCYVGLLFAIPLCTLIWSVAYLMMAGQIPSYNWTQQQSVYR